MGDSGLFQNPDAAFQYLRRAGSAEDKDIDLAEAALALGLIFLPGLHIDRYRQHLARLAEQVREEFGARLRAKKKDALELRVQVLRQVIHGENGYRGDEKNDDDIQNANFIRVIERRRGLPVSLGIIYIVLARKMGWACDGLSFPGHFIIRMEKDGARVILDPFKEGQEMNAATLRQLLKSIVGKAAELSHNFYDAVSNREILLRLENSLKKRLIDHEDYAQAIIAAEAIEAFSPQEYRTYLDKGVLYAKLGQKQPAIAALEAYIAKTPHAQERHQALLLLQQIKATPD
ncbi:MAG: transglutaminase-like domain-containing protein [Alphaproteobacteria bacterium]|nr:transglutaminase-like domain-containing protein [Alphaproteobacteria bacterium]